MSELPEALRPHVRPTWIPEVEAGEGPDKGSRFGGRPWLPEGAEWPRCPGCNRSMALFAQIDLATAPGDFPAPKQGLLQLFYCTSSEPLCESDHESWAPFGKAVLGRIVTASDGALGEPVGIEPLRARAVRRWAKSDDAPGWDEQEDLGVELTDEEQDALAEEMPRAGDKWLGWPYWIQGPEYATCRQCGTRMAFLLQIDSECNVDYMFGDVGTGHLFICPEHPSELSFHWACC